MSVYLEAVKARNEQRAAEVRARVEAAGRLPEGLQIGRTFCYLVGTDLSGIGLYEYRNCRMGGRSYWTVTSAGELGWAGSSRPPGFRKKG